MRFSSVPSGEENVARGNAVCGFLREKPGSAGVSAEHCWPGLSGCPQLPLLCQCPSLLYPFSLEEEVSPHLTCYFWVPCIIIILFCECALLRTCPLSQTRNFLRAEAMCPQHGAH